MNYTVSKCPFASEIKDELFDLVKQSIDHHASTLGSQQTKWKQWQDVPVFMRLFDWINDTIPSVITEFKNTPNPQAYKITDYWGMLYPEGAGTHEHCHHPCAISMGYYINYPQGSAPFIANGETIIPEEGDLIVIHGDTEHSVPEGYMTKDRCMIALNGGFIMKFANVYTVMCPECNHVDQIYELNSYGCPKCNTITPKENLLISCE